MLVSFISIVADTTGTHSYYTTCQAYEIMFHVSTLLPLESNRQQVCIIVFSRKSFTYMYVKQKV